MFPPCSRKWQCLHCLWDSRTALPFQGVAFMAGNLWLCTKASPTITWHGMYNVHMIFLFELITCHKVLFERIISIPGDVVITVLACCVERTWNLSNEVRSPILLCSGQASSLSLLSPSLSYFTSILFFLFFFCPRLTSLSTSTRSVSPCTAGWRCMPVPRWRGGEIDSEGVWSFLKDFPGKTLLSEW